MIRMMTVKDAIRTRRSVRKFKDTPVPDTIINELLESAWLSPSGGNFQNHVFGVIRDEGIKSELAKAAGNQMWIASAPVVIACCGNIGYDIAEQCEDDFALIVNKLRFGEDFINDMSAYPHRRAFKKLHHNGTPVISMIQIMLTATSHGLSSCPIGYLDIDLASEILNLPDDIACLYLLPLGYANEEPVEKELININEIIFFDKWDK